MRLTCFSFYCHGRPQETKSRGMCQKSKILGQRAKSKRREGTGSQQKQVALCVKKRDFKPVSGANTAQLLGVQLSHPGVTGQKQCEEATQWKQMLAHWTLCGRKNAAQGQEHPKWKTACVLRTNGTEWLLPGPQFWNLLQGGPADMGWELNTGQSPDLDTVSLGRAQHWAHRGKWK